MKQLLLAISLFILTLTLWSVSSSSGQAYGVNLAYDEAQTVYLGNLARRDNGAPPLRWNAQLTQASRWFSWDSVENRPEPYCGHEDTNGQSPWDRAWIFGYRGFAGAENAFCGYVTPQQAIDGWMNSEGHRANLLNPTFQEIGLGYYLRESDGRGYVTQLFGIDAVAPPVIIDNEAINTTDTAVDLYIHTHDSPGHINQMGQTMQMKVSDTPCFIDADWEPYANETTWTLPAGEGWRTVYVQAADALSRTVIVSDTIYLGSDVPLPEIGLGQATTNRPDVTLYGLDEGGWSHAQISPGWAVDDTFDTFALWWGNGQSVTDPDAWGGTAFRLEPGDGESFAWVWTTDFVKDEPLVAYFRLKVNDNTEAGEVARVGVEGGGVQYGPVNLAGIDFASPDVYQEFALPFTFHDDPDQGFLTFQFWRSGNTDVSVDAVTIFTAPATAVSPFTWPFPEGNYRGQGIWVRYSDGGSSFSAITQADTGNNRLVATPVGHTFLAGLIGPPPPTAVFHIQNARCTPVIWQATPDVTWLQLQTIGDQILVDLDLTGLTPGTYQGNILVEPDGSTAVPATTIPITLLLFEELHRLDLPVMIQ